MDGEKRYKQKGEELTRGTGLLEALLEQNPNFLNIFDAQGRYRLVSRVTAQVLGTTPEEMEGKAFYEVLPRPTAELFMERVRKLQEGKAPFTVVDEILGGDGEKRFFETWLFPLSREGDTVDLMGSVAVDITARRKAEMELQAAHARLLTVLNSIDAFIYTADMDTHEILFINEFGRETWGDITGQKCWKVIQAGQEGPCDFCTNPYLLDDRGRPGGIYQWEFQNSLNRRWYHCRDRAIPWIDGKIVRLQIATDITEQKLSEKKINEYAVELELKGIELEELYRHLDEEIKKAWKVHQRTLPEKLPRVEGLSLAYHYMPARNLGGDFFDVIEKGGQLVFYLSDVTGHGLDGAMMSVFVKSTISSYLSLTPARELSPREILRFLSRQFSQEKYGDEYFISIFMAVLELETLELTYAAAGFQESLLVKQGGGETLELGCKELPLSTIIPLDIMDLGEGKVTLEPGAALLLNSDGLSEQARGGESYQRRMKETFYRHSHLTPGEIVKAINDDFFHFNHASLQADDDVTFLVLKCR